MGGMDQGQGCPQELSSGWLVLPVGVCQGEHRVRPGPCSQGTKRRVFLTVTEVAN